jgi:hypothetical protein
MDRYAFLTELVTAAADCVPNAPDCTYDVFVGLGDPPQDCSMIAGFWRGATMLPQAANCRLAVRERFDLILTRCCLKNVGENFDPLLEDDDARCFYRDFGALFECLACDIKDILSPYVKTAQVPSLRVADMDGEVNAGCYTAGIAIEFDRYQPCPPCP